jgi:hypothetical protein
LQFSACKQILRKRRGHLILRREVAREKEKAAALILEITPKSPDQISYRKLWAMVLTWHAVRLTDVNTICANLRKSGELVFPDWETGKRVPKDHYHMHRA